MSAVPPPRVPVTYKMHCFHCFEHHNVSRWFPVIFCFVFYSNLSVLICCSSVDEGFQPTAAVLSWMTTFTVFIQSCTVLFGWHNVIGWDSQYCTVIISQCTLMMFYWQNHKCITCLNGFCKKSTWTKYWDHDATVAVASYKFKWTIRPVH